MENHPQEFLETQICVFFAFFFGQSLQPVSSFNTFTAILEEAILSEDTAKQGCAGDLLIVLLIN